MDVPPSPSKAVLQPSKVQLGALTDCYVVLQNMQLDNSITFRSLAQNE